MSQLTLNTRVLILTAIGNRRTRLFELWLEAHNWNCPESRTFWATELEKLNDAAREFEEAPRV